MDQNLNAEALRAALAQHQIALQQGTQPQQVSPVNPPVAHLPQPTGLPVPPTAHLPQPAPQPPQPPPVFQAPPQAPPLPDLSAQAPQAAPQLVQAPQAPPQVKALPNGIEGAIGALKTAAAELGLSVEVTFK